MFRRENWFFLNKGYLTGCLIGNSSSFFSAFFVAGFCAGSLGVVASCLGVIFVRGSSGVASAVSSSSSLSVNSE